ncbi:MAG TPA: hypothetical protein VM901_12990 [Bdellovibrionota bacterium]|jgi:hypothetical protein|nr:hypothetical protein [Bdellovibrionota bacterium]
MRKQNTFFGLLAAIVVFSAPSRAQNQIKKNVFEMSEQLESRIESRVKNLLGAEARVVVGVFIKEKRAPASTDFSSSNPWQVVGPYSVPTSLAFEGSGESARVDFERMEIKVQIEKAYAAKFQKEVESVVNDTVRGLRASVQVLANLEPLPPVTRNPASESLLENYRHLLPVVAAVIVLMGFLVVGLMLRSAATQVTEGFKQLKAATSVSLPQAPSIKVIDGESADSATNSKKSLPPPPAGRSADARKNIQIIEGALGESPLVFMRSLSQEPQDLLGLKFLITKISTESKAKLRDLLGAEMITKIQDYQAGEDVVSFDAMGWLQQLAEKLEMRKLAGGTVIEEALSGDDALSLSGAGADEMIRIAEELNSPAAWRLAVDFLPLEAVQEKMKSLSEDTWLQVLKSSEQNNPEDIKGALQEIQSKLGTPAAKGAGGLDKKTAVQRKNFFSQKLLPVLVDAVLSRPFGEDDEFLNRLVEQAPDFGAEMRERIWTPSRLVDIEDADLKELFLKLDNEQKSILIHVLPAQHKDRLVSFLPEGNGKRIVTDTVSRLASAADAETHREKHQSLAREFLDFLRARAQDGKLKMRKPVLDNVTPLQAKVDAQTPTSEEEIDREAS